MKNPEQLFVLDIPDSDLQVNGVLNPASAPDAPLVVMIHGLGGDITEHLHHNGSRVLNAAGFAVLRVSLYGDSPRARHLMDCDLHSHVSDIELVLRHFRDQGRRIAVIGHSLGGIVVQRTDHDLFDVAVLWEPTDVSMQHFEQWDSAEWVAEWGYWVMHWATDTLISPKMYDSWWKDLADHHDLKRPTIIIAASESWLPEPSRRYANAQSGPSRLVTVQGADHNFNQGDTAQEVFTTTLSWLKEHLGPC